MFDKELVIDSLQKIKAMLDLIIERSSVVDTPNDFLCSPGGMMRLDAITSRLTQTLYSKPFRKTFHK